MFYKLIKNAFYRGLIMIVNSVDVDNNMSHNFSIHLENGRKQYLFVLFKSPAMLFSNGEYIPVGYGVGVFFDKNAIQSYYGVGDVEFVHDFLLFDIETEYERTVFSSIKLGTPFVVRLTDVISNALRSIKQEFVDKNVYRDECICALGQFFLYRIKNELSITHLNDPEIIHYRSMQKLRFEIYSIPEAEWSIDNMCGRVHLSKYYFQRLYKEFYNISAIQDVIRARIEKAKKMLLNSDLSVSSISEKCGYKNPEHFIRQFKAQYGESPTSFRKSTRIEVV